MKRAIICSRIRQICPFTTMVHFDALKLRFVVHLGAAAHPIPKVNIRQAKITCDCDVVKNDESPKGVAVKIWIKERIDKAKTVIEDICKANSA